jgi:prepilin-type N-terminal cleavage/methylation domain-containing protein
MAEPLIRHKGFSLVELLVALVILGAVLLPFLSFLAYRLVRERENDEMIRAVLTAQSKMEEVMSVREIVEGEETVANKYLLTVDVVEENSYGLADTSLPVEIRITIYRLRDTLKLADLCALR